MSNGTILITLILGVACAAVAYFVLRTLARLWLEHRVKMAVLEKLERRPDLVEGLHELQELLENTPRERELAQRQNLVLTGLFLSFIGLGCAVAARIFFSGLYATGFYFGGVLCVPLGFILVLLGVLTKVLSRPTVPRSPQ